jgi:hypothetical protein
MDIEETDQNLIANGYEPVACVGKRPLNDRWQQRPNTIEAITADRAAMPSATNTGLRTGAVVGIDIDAEPAAEVPPGGDNPDPTPQIMALAQEVLGENLMQRVGSKGAMVVYRNAEPLSKIKIIGDHPMFKKPRKREPADYFGTSQRRPRPHQIAVEILGQGQQFVAYGIHPDTGRPYAWTYGAAGFEPLQTPHDELPEVTPDKLRELAQRCKALFTALGYVNVRATSAGEHAVAREAKRRQDKTPVDREYLVEMLGRIPAANYDGDRNGWIGILGAIQATPLRGVDEQEMDAELCEIADQWSSGGDSYNGRNDVEVAYYSLSPGKDGGTTFGTLYHLAREAGWDEPPPGCGGSEVFREAAAAMGNDGWPEPLDVFGDMLCLEPALRRELLPRSIADWAWDEADRLGVDPSMLAIPACGVVAAAIDNRIQIQPMEHNTGWLERALLWLLMIAPPGGRKTPAMNKATEPLRGIEQEHRKQYALQKAEYDDAMDVYKAALKKGEPVDRPVKPTELRFTINGITMEKLGEIEEANEHGLLAFYDEIAAFVAGLNAYRNGAGPDRQAALALWNGVEGYQVDRKAAGSSYNVPLWGACLLGGVQPDKLRAMVVKNNLTDDGLLQRFLSFTGETYGRGVDRAPDYEARQRYHGCVRALAGFGPGTTGFPADAITLSPEARPYWDRFEALCQSLAREKMLPAALRDHFSKAAGLGARLMLTFHMVECTGSFPAVINIRTVSGATAKRACTLMKEYFIPHALRMYREFCTDYDDGTDLLRRVGRVILASDKDTITDRDVYRGNSALAGTMMAGPRSQAMAAFAGYGWVRPAVDGWLINPKLERFAEQRAHARAEAASEHKRATEARRTWQAEFGVS